MVWLCPNCGLLWSHFFTSRRYRTAPKALCPDCRR